MCLLWVTTYVLVLVSTLKYRYPATSLFMIALVAPFEFSTLISIILKTEGNFGFPFYAYLIWSIMEIPILISVLITGNHSRKKIFAFIATIIIVSLLTFYGVFYQSQTLFFSYFNTFLGELFWLGYIAKRQFHPQSIHFAFCITKLIADLIAVPVFGGMGSWTVNSICVILPVIDLLFIAICLEKKNEIIKKDAAENNCVRCIRTEN